MKIDINISLSENSTGTRWTSDLSSQDLCPESRREVKLLIGTFVEDLEEELFGESPGNTPTSKSLESGSKSEEEVHKNIINQLRYVL